MIYVHSSDGLQSIFYNKLRVKLRKAGYVNKNTECKDRWT